MGKYASVSGSLICGSEDEIAIVKDIIEGFHNVNDHRGLSKDQRDLYNKGWVLPNSHVNGDYYIFYGANIREYCLDFIKSEIQIIANELTRLDDEGDGDEFRGLFYIHHDDDASVVTWLIIGTEIVEKAIR